MTKLLLHPTSGKLLRSAGFKLFKRIAAECPCPCNTAPPAAACPVCPSGGPYSFLFTPSGITDSICTNCAALNAGFTLINDGSQGACVWWGIFDIEVCTGTAQIWATVTATTGFGGKILLDALVGSGGTIGGGTGLLNMIDSSVYDSPGLFDCTTPRTLLGVGSAGCSEVGQTASLAPI